MSFVLDPRAKDITGLRVGKLVAVRPVGRNNRRKIVWECLCDCGETIERLGYLLTRAKKKGQPSSCGCDHHLKEHGLLTKDAPDENWLLNYIWKGMRQRCFNPENNDYHRYGGRGISICEEWEDFARFYQWANEAGYEKGLTIERVDVNGDYCPENCTWIPNSEQALNWEDSLLFTYNGKTQGIRAWAEERGINYHTLKARLTYYGWSVERALTETVGDVS